MAHDVRIHQAALKKENQQESTASTVTTTRAATKKFPRLHIENGDEVQEAPPPQKFYDIIDLTSEDGAAVSTMNIGTPTAPVANTPTTRRRGRPRLHRAETSDKDGGTERDDTQRM